MSANIKLPAKIEHLNSILQFVRDCARDEGFSRQRISNIELATEEVLANVCRYAYAEDCGDIEISCRTDDDRRLIIDIIDAGIPFNILTVSEPDLNTDIAIERKQTSLIRDMHQQVDLLHLASVNQKHDFEIIYHYLDDKRNLLAATPSIRPVASGWISSGFGYRKSPFTGRREFHKGLDIATHKGEPIVATADGTVVYAGKKGLLGNLVVVEHGYGMVTRYGHIHKFLKKPGDTVKRGDKIALVGSTGRSTGPHVHYEVRLNGIQVNPRKYILN